MLNILKAFESHLLSCWIEFQPVLEFPGLMRLIFYPIRQMRCIPYALMRLYRKANWSSTGRERMSVALISLPVFLSRRLWMVRVNWDMINRLS